MPSILMRYGFPAPNVTMKYGVPTPNQLDPCEMKEKIEEVLKEEEMSGNGDMEFLVRGRVNGLAKMFGPFRSQERAEQTLVKVCDSFESCEILCKTKSRGIYSLKDEFFGNTDGD